MFRERVCGRAACAAPQLEHGRAARQHLHQASRVPGPLFNANAGTPLDVALGDPVVARSHESLGIVDSRHDSASQTLGYSCTEPTSSTFMFVAMKRPLWGTRL